MTQTTDLRDPVVRKLGAKGLGPDLISLTKMHELLGIDDAFQAEFGILRPHLRKLTADWHAEIPMKIVSDECTQDTMTIRDLNRINAFVRQTVTAMNDGDFGEKFEGPIDGIALILKTHRINPGWATAAFASTFDAAQHRLYFETRQANVRIYPAALRCLNKISALTQHLLGRRDHELSDATTQRGGAVATWRANP